MEIKDITADWLKQQKWDVKKQNEVTIDGVKVWDLKPIVDGRGDVTELWNEKWVERGGLVPRHIYQSATDYGVIKCWHLHAVHTDQFTVTRGKLQVSIIDVREGSPTFGQVNAIILGTLTPKFVQIPFGLVHGWKALAGPETIVVNVQSHPYDPADEMKFPWDTMLVDVWQPHNG